MDRGWSGDGRESASLILTLWKDTEKPSAERMAFPHGKTRPGVARGGFGLLRADQPATYRGRYRVCPT